MSRLERLGLDVPGGFGFQARFLELPSGCRRLVALASVCNPTLSLDADESRAAFVNLAPVLTRKRDEKEITREPSQYALAGGASHGIRGQVATGRGRSSLTSTGLDPFC